MHFKSIYLKFEKKKLGILQFPWKNYTNEKQRFVNILLAKREKKMARFKFVMSSKHFNYQQLFNQIQSRCPINEETNSTYKWAFSIKIKFQFDRQS